MSTLTPPEVIALTRQPVDRVNDPTDVLLASVYCYDQRGGGVETPSKAISKAWRGPNATKTSERRLFPVACMLWVGNC